MCVSCRRVCCTEKYERQALLFVHDLSRASTFSLFLPFSSFPVGLRDQLPTSANRLTADRLMGRAPQYEIESEYSISSKSG